MSDMPFKGKHLCTKKDNDIEAAAKHYKFNQKLTYFKSYFECLP